ncbi:hypothetical protein BU23DRAFT_123945 [Bimuria novae-zelandiae CBS 107.79]|uniref:Histone chaperone domain-containing protein n=1 Tax=Bimuria novae-zelandiae CBS 107.79 TaxID=1447943 RepID=A0A6A5VBR1_9PLEO|nr:hypothetical protein BU23DRAFT_123945 [Bimuria novae-zelandiae CBS 107.79]
MAPVASPSNPYKRHIDAVQRVYDCAKRLKTNHEGSNSAPSTVSDHSVLLPTSVPEDTTEASDDESWVSESSEEPSDESDIEESEDGSDAGDDGDEDEEEGKEDSEHGEDTVVNIRANRGERPSYKLPEDEELEDIRPFLKDFLPQLKAANEELEAQREAGTLRTSEIIGDEDGDSEEQYIEMNLGLGVLEEKADDADTGLRVSSDGEDEAEREGENGQDRDILGKLMGRDKAEEPPSIQEVTENQEHT